ncbi:HAD family hydrolase [Clostridium sp. MB40-C1]|uniref:HAD family hydrolase n=1 Tax=Clostridium sp. MB40-C1 TaxID=3070996 RepID=UPI0027DFB331|nr:HAD family hydrolase [Clostridium sp. MB40-C1]WMJ79896.1 HAD family hydrolase [Clostridium sp. MB40-C1]
MIFASDLDRTLIYSKKLIDHNGEDIVLVERYNGEDLSFMKKAVIDKLGNMKEKIMFIPVTTRTIDQYNRIFMIKDHIKPKYAVVSNGGNILINGEIDKDWRNIIEKKIERVIHYKFVQKRFLESFKDVSWINKMILRDKLFFSIHFDNKDKINLDELYKFKEWAEANYWNVSLQGRKLYIVPSAVNKWDAVLYIKQKERIDKVVSAGDSLLDYPILINAEYSMCASHGELFKMIQDKILNKEHIVLTDSMGIDASEEIVNNVVNLSANGSWNNI